MAEAPGAFGDIAAPATTVRYSVTTELGCGHEIPPTNFKAFEGTGIDLAMCAGWDSSSIHALDHPKNGSL
eukprot:666935-Amphidinium_carterae.1